jgi:hypothetical protein
MKFNVVGLSSLEVEEAREKHGSNELPPPEVSRYIFFSFSSTLLTVFKLHRETLGESG